MILSLVIAFISLILLLIIHELGHFLLAKKFGIKVEEFGIFYPPRIYGKKFGQTIYSINLLPFGAFVKILGEEERKDDPDSFSSRPFWQKSLVIIGGVVSFWLVSILLLGIVNIIGAPTIISDKDSFSGAKVQIYGLSNESPAKIAGLLAGDVIVNIGGKEISKVEEVQDISADNKGKETVFTIQRGKQVFNVSLTPRAIPPKDEGPLGVILVRTAIKHYPWYLAFVQGAKTTYDLSIATLNGWYHAFIKMVNKQPTGVQIMGPVGIFGLFFQVSQLGVVYFLQFIALISISIALFNLLPIPVTDGGKLLFLIIEKIRRKALNQKIEQGISLLFFSLLILLMIFVTIKDVSRLF